MGADNGGFKVQLNLKTGDNMLNVRGDSASDLLGELDTLANLSAEIDSAVTAIQSMECLKSGGVHPGANSNAAGARSGGQNTQGRGCIHGPMTYRTGQGARGPWQGWFCPQPKGAPDACKPVFQNG